MPSRKNNTAPKLIPLLHNNQNHIAVQRKALNANMYIDI